MKNNIPLNDNDRVNWLINLSSNIKIWQNSGEPILACSLLKESYRNFLNLDLKSKIYFSVWIRRYHKKKN